MDGRNSNNHYNNRQKNPSLQDKFSEAVSQTTIIGLSREDKHFVTNVLKNVNNDLRDKTRYNKPPHHKSFSNLYTGKTDYTKNTTPAGNRNKNFNNSNNRKTGKEWQNVSVEQTTITLNSTNNGNPNNKIKQLTEIEEKINALRIDAAEILNANVKSTNTTYIKSNAKPNQTDRNKNNYKNIPKKNNNTGATKKPQPVENEHVKKQQETQNILEAERLNLEREQILLERKKLAFEKEKFEFEKNKKQQRK